MRIENEVHFNKIIIPKREPKHRAKKFKSLNLVSLHFAEKKYSYNLQPKLAFSKFKSDLRPLQKINEITLDFQSVPWSIKKYLKTLKSFARTLSKLLLIFPSEKLSYIIKSILG